MKYYNIDLTQFVPYGIPLNSTDKVESKNHINEFFLRGFENWYNQLFTVDEQHLLVQDYSRSCAAPYSLSTCKYCTDDQLEKFIQGEGFIYYSTNDHDVNAKFVYDLFKYSYGTQEYLSSIAQYVSNNPNVEAEILYEGYSVYEYGIRIYGDIVGAETTPVMADRILEHLKILGTAHTRLRSVEFEETSPEIDTYAACIGDNSCIYYESIIREFNIDPDRDIITYSACKADNASVYYESEIKEVKPKPPEIDTFDPNVPFCIENMGDAPVEVGLYNNSSTKQIRTNCKISYDSMHWQNYSLALAINPTDSLIGRITLANKGDRVYVKADLTTEPDANNYTHLTVLNSSVNTKIRVRGNIASLNKGTNDAYKTDYLTADRACYVKMFMDCTALIQAPELPATTLGIMSYESMFWGCAALTQAPDLAATNLAYLCCGSMFQECAALTKAGLLPATKLSGYCYNQMFQGCTSLVQAPSLPATTLADSCYTFMFYKCSNLNRAPLLPATALISNCYKGMFRDCTNLTYVKCLATTIPATNCTSDWLNNVSATGDFYTPAATNWASGNNGIPAGWTRHDV